MTRGVQEKWPRMLLAGTDEPMKNLLLPLALAICGITLLGPSAQAQRRGFVSSRVGRGGGGFVGGPGARGHRGWQGRVRRISPRFGYAPYFYSGFGYDSGFGLNSAYEPTLELPPPQPVVEEPSAAVAPVPQPNAAEGPVLLELQGDHWVRITSDGSRKTVGQSYRPEPEAATNPSTAEASAVLVFRDGHEEEIGKYCIIGGTIHISADYWSTGSWTRTVKISDLDIPATLKLNRERDTHFRLPSGPFEVMIGG